MKFRNGALVLAGVASKTFRPQAPDVFKSLARGHNVPESIVPAYAGDRAIAGRAIQSHLGTARANGWQVDRLTATPTTLVYAISRIDKDAQRERIEYAQDDTLRWSSEHTNGVCIEGWHQVARDVDKTYQEMRGLVFAADWTSKIIDYIRGECRGVPIREQGGGYWVPTTSADKLTALRGLLTDVGIALFVAEIEPEDAGHAREAAQRGLSEQIKELLAKVQDFDSTQNASVYKGSLEELSELWATANAYNDAVGIRLAEIQGVMG